MTTFTMDDYHLMRKHAGYSYNPATETREQGAVRSALELARLAYSLRADRCAFMSCEPSMFAWDGDFPMTEGTVLLDCTLHRGGEVVASLASVNVRDSDADCRYRDPYLEVVAAELYGDYREGVVQSAVQAYCES